MSVSNWSFCSTTFKSCEDIILFVWISMLIKEDNDLLALSSWYRQGNKCLLIALTSHMNKTEHQHKNSAFWWIVGNPCGGETPWDDLYASRNDDKSAVETFDGFCMEVILITRKSISVYLKEKNRVRSSEQLIFSAMERGIDMVLIRDVPLKIHGTQPWSKYGNCIHDLHSIFQIIIRESFVYVEVTTIDTDSYVKKLQ